MRKRAWFLGMLAGGVLVALPAPASATQVYVASDSNSTIAAFNIGAGGSVSRIACTGSACTTGPCPEGLTLTPNDRFLYATDCENNVVNEFSVATSGALSQLCAGSCPATGGDPLGVASSPNGKFVFAANGNSGTVSPFAVGSGGGLTAISCATCGTMSFPVGLAVSPNGKFVYVADQDNQNVAEFSVNSTGSLTPLCSTSCPSAGLRPFNLSVTPNGQFLFVTDNNGNKVLPFAINSDGTLTAVACATCATGPNPVGIAVSPDGRFVYTANQGSISAFSINSGGTLTPIACAACVTAKNYAGVVVEPSSHYVYANADNGDRTATLAPFAIGSDGSLTPISCSPSVCTFTGGEFDISNIAASPDEAPVAKFTHGTARAGRSTSFNGSGSTAYQNATVARYDWSFGDGKKVLNGGAKPKHRYAKPGNYRATLTVTDSLGCSTQQVYTGQTMSCNGSSVATITHRVHVTAVAKAKLSLRNLPAGCVRSSSKIGVRVSTASGSAPHRTSVSVDGHQVAHSTKLSFSVTISLSRLKVGSNTVSAASVDRFGRRSTTSAHINRCATSAAFTG